VFQETRGFSWRVRLDCLSRWRTENSLWGMLRRTQGRIQIQEDMRWLCIFPRALLQEFEHWARTWHRWSAGLFCSREKCIHYIKKRYYEEKALRGETTSKDEKERSGETHIIREKIVIVKVRCPYCSKLYDETLDVCPHCRGKRWRRTLFSKRLQHSYEGEEEARVFMWTQLVSTTRASGLCPMFS